MLVAQWRRAVACLARCRLKVVEELVEVSMLALAKSLEEQMQSDMVDSSHTVVMFDSNRWSVSERTGKLIKGVRRPFEKLTARTRLNFNGRHYPRVRILVLQYTQFSLNLDLSVEPGGT